MPRLNRLGQWCSGIGGSEVYAQPYGFIAAPAGAATWKDDSTVVFSWRVALPDTWSLAETSPAGLHDIAGSGANWIEAGGGIWAAGIGGSSPRVWTSDGRTFDRAAITAVGDDGSLVIRPDYFASFSRIVHRDGTTEDLNFACLSPHRVGNTMAYVDGSGQVRGWNVHQPVNAPGLAFQPRILTFPDGSRWLLVVRTEVGRERLLLHPWDSLTGYVLAEASANLPTFRPDGLALSQTSARVVFAGNAAETHDSIRVVSVDLTKPRADLSAPFSPPIVSIGRPTWMACFNFAPATTPGNAVLNTSDLIVRDTHGLAVAQYVASSNESDINALDTAIAAAKSKGLPVLAYWTRQAQAVRLPKGADVVAVEAYRDTTESLAAFEARVRAAVARCQRAALVCQAYTSNTRNTADIASLVPVYAKIAKDCGNVWGLLVFSGSGRPTGLQDHPDVLPLWQSVAAGIPSAPSVEEFMEPWHVTFDESYSKVIARGVGAVAKVSIGNGIDIEWQKGADDTIHFAVYENGTLRNRSSLPRHVEVRG